MTPSRAELLRLTASAAALTWFVCAVSWPGFMSYDGMVALRQARHGIETGGYPPMVSYVWALWDAVVPGQGGMFAFQNALVFLGTVALGRAIGAREARILLALVVLAIAPATLGPMLVVWKDVAFAGLMAFAYAWTLRYLAAPRALPLALALSFVLLASSFRLNGIAAALPALAAIAWTMCGADARRKRLAAGAAFVALAAATFGFVTLLSTWRLPDLRRIDLVTGSGWTQAGDLVGISVCARRNLVPAAIYDGEMTLERLEQIYHPEHSQLSAGPPPLLRESGIFENADEVEAAAMRARREHPLCYLRHRANVFAYAIGANAGPVFYLTDFGVHPGEPGTDVAPSRLNHYVAHYLRVFDGAWFARGISFAIAALAAVLLALVTKDGVRVARALLPIAGACAYLAGSFFVVPGADARYNFFPALVFVAAACFLLPGPRRSAGHRPS